MRLSGSRLVLLFIGVLLCVVGTACTAASTRPRESSSASGATASSTDASSTSAPSSTASVSSPSSHPLSSGSTTARSGRGRLTVRPTQLTRQGLWWAVDSVAPINESSLANVRDWYVGGHDPVAWGRYVTRLHPAELRFAKAHGIALYLIIPDRDCSVCDGGADVCGSDRTAGQAHVDAAAAVAAARRLRIPAGATLFKDIEQVGSCSGELTSKYLLAWYHDVRATKYRVGFYGNTYRQSWDFPRAYCAAVRSDPRLVADVPLAQDEPEPQISKPRHTIGPHNAPAFAPYHPKCVPSSVVKIWQYGESTTGGNVTDVDEIRPDTPGLLTPDGGVT